MIDQDIAIIENYKLNPTELLIVKLIFLKQEGYNEGYLVKFLSVPENKELFRPTLISLQNKGIILKSYKIPDKGEKFDPLEIALNKNFVRALWKASFELGMELRERYPKRAIINGTYTSLMGIAKKFDSLEDFYRFYGKTIGWNEDKHKQILALIDWEQQNGIGFINMSLSTFVIEHKWEELELLKSDFESGSLSNVKFDTITQL